MIYDNYQTNFSIFSFVFLTKSPDHLVTLCLNTIPWTFLNTRQIFIHFLLEFIVLFHSYFISFLAICISFTFRNTFLTSTYILDFLFLLFFSFLSCFPLFSQVVSFPFNFLLPFFFLCITQYIENNTDFIFFCYLLWDLRKCNHSGTFSHF